MKRSKSSMAAIATFLVVSGCGGGGGTPGPGGFGSTLASDYTSLVAQYGSAGLTDQSALDSRTDRVRYQGAMNIFYSDRAYLGEMNATVDFAADTLSGTGRNFSRYDATVTSTSTGTGVSGDVSLNGALTGMNDSIGDGIAGSATGRVDGRTIDMGLRGHFATTNATALYLYMDDNTSSGAGGVGVGVVNP